LGLLFSVGYRLREIRTIFSQKCLKNEHVDISLEVLTKKRAMAGCTSLEDKLLVEDNKIFENHMLRDLNI
jgi:hypothetical protein